MGRWLVGFLLLGLGTLHAEVLESSATGFSLQCRIEVDAGPDRTFRGLTQELPKWWDPAHTYSGSSRYLSLDPTAGGCFCERFPGGSVEHGRVLNVSYGKLLRIAGSMGPLQALPVNAVLDFSLEPLNPGTRVILTYRVAGPLGDNFAQWATVVDSVLASQLQRFAKYLETGEAPRSTAGVK